MVEKLRKHSNENFARHTKLQEPDGWGGAAGVGWGSNEVQTETN